MLVQDTRPRLGLRVNGRKRINDEEIHVLGWRKERKREYGCKVYPTMRLFAIVFLSAFLLRYQPVLRKKSLIREVWRLLMLGLLSSFSCDCQAIGNVVWSGVWMGHGLARDIPLCDCALLLLLLGSMFGRRWALRKISLYFDSGFSCCCSRNPATLPWCM